MLGTTAPRPGLHLSRKPPHNPPSSSPLFSRPQGDPAALQAQMAAADEDAERVQRFQVGRRWVQYESHASC